MVVIAEGYHGQVSVTKEGKVNIQEGTFDTIHLAVLSLFLARPEEGRTSEQLRRNFHSVLPDFSSVKAIKTPMFEKIAPAILEMAETTEDNLRTLGFIKPVKKLETHPLKNQLLHVFESEKRQNPLKIETKLISTWLQFLQKIIDEKKDLSPLNYLTLASLLQSNYLKQAERLVAKISSDPGTIYSELKETHSVFEIISTFMLNPHILYSQPFKQTAEKLQQEINNIEDPGISGYDHLYLPRIRQLIESCFLIIRPVLDNTFD